MNVPFRVGGKKTDAQGREKTTAFGGLAEISPGKKTLSPHNLLLGILSGEKGSVKFRPELRNQSSATSGKWSAPSLLAITVIPSSVTVNPRERSKS